VPKKQPMSAERFDHIDQTLDRILGILQDHGRQLDELKADVRELKADIREIRREVVGIHEAFTEHLGWHLGRAG
jgi:chromosome segregation ATPase